MAPKTTGKPGKKQRGDARKAPPQPAVRPAVAGTPWGPQQTWMVFILILAFSVLLGVIAVAQFRESPFFNLPIIDEESYVNWADQIAGGDVIGKTIFYQDPLYPYFLAFLFTVFGKSFLMVRLCQVALGAMSVALVFWTARKLLGDVPALLAAAIVAGYGAMYFFELQLEKGVLIIFLSALSCALGVAAADRPRSPWRFAAVGVSIGLLTLLRGNFIPMIPFIVLWAAAIPWKSALSQRLLRAGLLSAGIGLIILPVSIRNYVVGGEFVMTTSQGGANFFIGNNERANGRYVTLPFVRANPQFEAGDFKAEAEKRVGHPLLPAEVSGFWFHESMKWIEANPEKALLLFLHKARLMIHEHEIPDNHSLYLTRDVFVSALWLPFLRLGLLWGAAVVGIIVLVKKDERSIYPALFAVLYAGSIIPFFIVDRYRLPVVPSLAVFSSAFFFWAHEKWRERNKKPLAAAGIFIAIALLLGLLPTSESRAPMGAEYYLLGNGYLKTDQPDKAVPWYDKAIAALPDNEDAMRNRAEALRRLNGGELSLLVAEAQKPETTAPELLDLGKQFEQLGQIKLAVEAYEKAAAKDPDLFSAHARLGYLYTTRPEVKNMDKALRHLQRALEIQPDNLDTLNAIGNCQFMAGNTVEARKAWEQIILKQPDNGAAKQNLEMMEKSRASGEK
ncbi:MAG TPA: glycosyltransferase family 39 protein [bacterium]|nr:glycosyltransferase family 39 protein [bacterium]